MQKYCKKKLQKNRIPIKCIIFEQNFDKMSIGSKIRKYRMLKNLSQSDLAFQAETSQSEISSVESDKTIPNSVILNRIAKVLDVNINELLKDDSIVQNNYGKSIGNINSQVTINNLFPEDVIQILMSNQEKINDLLETQNKLIDALIKKMNL